MNPSLRVSRIPLHLCCEGNCVRISPLLTMTCGGEPTDKSASYLSHAGLVLIHGPHRNGTPRWVGMDPNKETEIGVTRHSNFLSKEPKRNSPDFWAFRTQSALCFFSCSDGHIKVQHPFIPEVLDSESFRNHPLLSNEYGSRGQPISSALRRRRHSPRTKRNANSWGQSAPNQVWAHSTSALIWGRIRDG